MTLAPSFPALLIRQLAFACYTFKVSFLFLIYCFSERCLKFTHKLRIFVNSRKGTGYISFCMYLPKWTLRNAQCKQFAESAMQWKQCDQIVKVKSCPKSSQSCFYLVTLSETWGQHFKSWSSFQSNVE